MSTPPTTALGATIARIAAPADHPDSPRSGLTGALGELDVWWAQRTGSARPIAQVIVTGIVTGIDAMSAEDALMAGLSEADRAIDSGATLIIPRAANRDLVTARSIIGLLTKRDAAAVTHQPEGMPDAEWMASCAAVRDLMADHRDLIGDQVAMLQALQAQHIATVAGILIGAAARGTPCLIDGTDEWAGALVADRLAHRARHWWRAAATSADPARTAARARIDLPAGLPLGLTDEEGWGARAIVTLLDLIAPTSD